MSRAEDVRERVSALIEPLAEVQGLEVVEVEFHRPRRGRAVLRIFLDKKGGITLDEITRMSRVVSEVLDVHDVIGGAYTLEVSSPGLTRELKKPRDFERYEGRIVRITTRSALGGRQVHRGVLKGLEGGEVTLEEGEEMVRIPLAEIAKARLDF